MIARKNWKMATIRCRVRGSLKEWQVKNLLMDNSLGALGIQGPERGLKKENSDMTYPRK